MYQVRKRIPFPFMKRASKIAISREEINKENTTDHTENREAHKGSTQGTKKT